MKVDAMREITTTKPNNNYCRQSALMVVKINGENFKEKLNIHTVSKKLPKCELP